MSKQRKQYSAAFKSKVALEAIKGVRSANEIATHYGVQRATPPAPDQATESVKEDVQWAKTRARSART